MILTATQEYTPHAAGVFPAVCVDLIDLGLQEVNWHGELHTVHRLRLVWETESPDGSRAFISRSFTASLNTRANLNGFLANWRGKPIVPGDSVDLKKLIGVSCTLVISQQQATEGTGLVARIEGISRPTKTITASGTYDSVAARARIAQRARRNAAAPPPATRTTNTGLAPAPEPEPEPEPIDDDVPF